MYHRQTQIAMPPQFAWQCTRAPPRCVGAHRYAALGTTSRGPMAQELRARRGSAAAVAC